MTCDKIKSLLKQGAKLLDVRTQAEYANGRIEDSTNIPLDQFHNIEDNIDLEQTILLYCQSGGRSGMAANYLQQRGYNVINLGGINQFIGCIER